MHSHNPAIKKIVLIDDDEDDYLIFDEAIHIIDDSIELKHIRALKDIEDVNNCFIPDLLFLDINMPDRDGFDWLKAIRSSGYDFPIIMYSTARNPSYVDKAYTEGANLYFPKPESFHVLTESLQCLLSLNWSEPGAITKDLYQDGHYKVFSLAV